MTIGRKVKSKKIDKKEKQEKRKKKKADKKETKCKARKKNTSYKKEGREEELQTSEKRATGVKEKENKTCFNQFTKAIIRVRRKGLLGVKENGNTLEAI